jgi:hypothetical protein
MNLHLRDTSLTSLSLLFAVALAGCQLGGNQNRVISGGRTMRGGTNTFTGSKAGDEREVSGVKLCWCPAGRFRMGSPPDETDRRPDEAPVEVVLTKGFWMGKYEVTQGQWRGVTGKFPGERTEIAGEGDEFPVYWINFTDAEEFCRKLTGLAHQSGDLPAGWEFQIPTEAQWEYACRAGTTTATSFGNSLNRRQANFAGKPYAVPDGPRRWAVIPPTPGDCTICTATNSSGAGIGITQNCLAASIRICIPCRASPTATALIRESAGAEPGMTTASFVAPHYGYGMSRRAGPITSVFASSSFKNGLSHENHADDIGKVADAECADAPAPPRLQSSRHRAGTSRCYGVNTP